MNKNMKKQVQRAFNAWLYAFKEACKADVDHVNDWDECATLASYNEWLAEETNQTCLISSGQRVMNITGEVAAAVIASLQNDGRDDSALKFLEQQRYIRSGEACPKYVFVFDFGDKINGCAILRGDDLSFIDLADLHDHPFYRLQICGFLTLYVARADRSLLDLDTLQKAIKDDLQYDREEDELEIEFWPNNDQTVLSVTVYDRSAEELEDERERRVT